MNDYDEFDANRGGATMMMRLNRPLIESTAFLLCDIQESFGKVMLNSGKYIKTANKMIEASKILNIPLIVTEQNPTKLGSTSSQLDISSAKLVDSKMAFSMWTPNVANYLKNQAPQIKFVVLFGIETVQDFLLNDYQVFVLADGVDSQNPFEVQVALDQMRANGAIITTSDSILFQLLKTAEHPKFRDISKLVKLSSSKL